MDEVPAPSYPPPKTDLFQSTLTPVSHERPGGLLEQAIVRGTLAFGFSP